MIYDTVGIKKLFYSNRIIDHPLANNVSTPSNPEELITAMNLNPEKTWLSSIAEFRKLAFKFPNEIYLIQANSKYAYFTSIKNRDNIHYDFSEMVSPLIK